MASITTLTSLAILKVNIDEGRDYLDYIKPFILQVLVDHKPDPVTDQVVKEYLQSDFGLHIPRRTVQIILKRISRTGLLERFEWKYYIKKQLPDPGILTNKTKADRHIRAVISGLLIFYNDNYSIEMSEDTAIEALCAFLSEFSIQCIKAYLRGTAIPDIAYKRYAHIVLVGQYIIYLQNNDPERFESLLILVQGHMLANALLCPDLQNAPKSYNGVSFYMDTPLIVQLLGLEGQAKQQAIEELITLLSNLGATVAVFNHSREELHRVIKGAAYHIDSPNGRGAIVMEARRKRTTKSDLLLLDCKLDELLDDAGIIVKETPAYIANFQIDEEAFEQVLEDEVDYYNTSAKQYDINSVRSIYVLRSGQSPTTLEKCKAVLVTSNSAFARAAYEYGANHEETREVSSVITDFSLANMAWLKSPMEAPSLPSAEFMAYAYAALQPSRKMLDRYLEEIDKLERNGKISHRDHQLLRSSSFAQDQLMILTLGEEDALTPETVEETLGRLRSEIKKEEKKRLEEEKRAHDQTQTQLMSAKRERKALQERLFLKCKKKAQLYAWMISIFLSSLLICGIFVGFGLTTTIYLLGWLLTLGASALIVFTIANLAFGTTVKRLHRAVEDKFLARFIKKESKATGINIENKD